jgi:predicted dehydrogenase
MSDPVKIAVVGGGYGSKVALPVLSDSVEFEVLGIWSRRPERARELASDAGIPLGTADIEALLGLDGLEAVHVAAPVVMHAEIAIAAAERGLHVLCEKPLASDLSEAREIVDAIDAAGVVGAVNYGRRFQGTRRRLLELVHQVLGAPRMVSISLVHSDHADPDSRPYTWVQDAEMGGGRLQGYGVHDLDLLVRAFGGVEAVCAASEVGVKQREDSDGSMRDVTAEDTYAILLRFHGGGIGIVSFLATARHKRGDVLEFHGEDGTVRLAADNKIWWGRKGEDLRCEGPLSADSKDAYGLVAHSFWSAIREGKTPDPSLGEALKVQAVLDAVYASAAEGGWVEPASAVWKC